MLDDKVQSRKPRTPIALRALEIIGLLSVVYGLASSRLWFAVFGVGCIGLSYWLYRKQASKSGAGAANGNGTFGYDHGDSSDGGD